MLSAVHTARDRTRAGRSHAERRTPGPEGDARGGSYARSETLSSRELAVLEELAKGTSTDDIAGKLFVSPHTVRTHIKNILRKLGARTRAHAVAIAYSEHAIDPEVTPPHSD